MLAGKAVDEGELEDIDLIEAVPEAAEVEAEAAPAAAASKPKAGKDAEVSEEEEAAPEEAATAEAAQAAPAGGAFGNLFAERLKVALAKKRQESAEKPTEEKE